MNQVHAMTLYESISLKLGIKSSLPKPRETMALLILIYCCLDSPFSVSYSESELNNKLKISDSLADKIYEMYLALKPNVIVTKNEFVDKYLNNNPLVSSQVEALNVAFELVWKLARIKFIQGSLALNIERTGGVRYPKKIEYTRNIDIISLCISQQKKAFYKCLFLWLMDTKDVFQDQSNVEGCEQVLLTILVCFTEETIYSAVISGESRLFNLLSIYKKLIENGNVNCSDDDENTGPLRILHSLITNEMYPLLKKGEQGIHVVDHQENTLQNYAERVNAYLEVTHAQHLKPSDVANRSGDINLSERAAEYLSKGKNIIFYGAPGTGKSHRIEQLISDNNSRRIVFHQETQNSDFIGALQPSMGEEGIEYSFKPGPMIEILIDAINDQKSHYYLIIEELNRASAAAVFGDFFQLLDRNSDGSGTYSIDIVDKNLLNYLQPLLGGRLVGKKLKMPANLSIYATMNSSDQAVMPLDTAFKRRWEFEYIPIDFSLAPDGEFSYDFDGETKLISWKLFALSVNNLLKNQNVSEDRLLGPWFVKSHEIGSDKLFKDTLKGKIFSYLWDDVLRHGRAHIIFNGEIRTYGDLIATFDAGKNIFSSELNELLFVKNNISTFEQLDVEDEDN